MFCLSVCLVTYLCRSDSTSILVATAFHPSVNVLSVCLSVCLVTYLCRSDSTSILVATAFHPSVNVLWKYLSHVMRKPVLYHMRTTKAQISLRICASLYSLINTFVVRCLDGIIPILAKSKISGLKLASEAEQACLSLTTPEDRFSCNVAHFRWNGEQRNLKLITPTADSDQPTYLCSPMCSLISPPCPHEEALGRLLCNQSHVKQKRVFGICDQVRFKPACSATEAS